MREGRSVGPRLLVLNNGRAAKLPTEMGMRMCVVRTEDMLDQVNVQREILNLK